MTRTATTEAFKRAFEALPEDLQRSVMDKVHRLMRNEPVPSMDLKVMKGRSDKPIWQVRLSKQARMLLTWGRDPQQEGGQILYLVDLFADHDDVSRRHRRLNLGFLEGEVLYEVPWEGPLPEHPGAQVSGLQDLMDEHEWRDAATVRNAFRDFSGELPPAYDDPMEYLAWYLLEGQADVFAPTSELILTQEQYEMLRLPLPLMLGGSAGSGKTTVGLYLLRLFAQSNPESRVAYVAFNDFLVNRAKNLYMQLPSARSNKVDFVTYDVLMREALPRDKREASLQEKMLYHHGARFRIPFLQPEVLDEIRAVIRGGFMPDTVLRTPADVPTDLSREQYLALPHDWAVEEGREAIYERYQHYKRYLRGNGLLDDQQLATEALKGVLASGRRRYDLLVLDEVQDLTPKQIRTVLKLAKTYLLCGDPTQTLYATRFAWRTIKEHFYTSREARAAGSDVNERMRHLSRSFRGTFQITQRAQRLSAYMMEAGVPDVSPFRESGMQEGPEPALWSEDFARTHLSTRNPNVAVLVPSEKERASLRLLLGHDFVFTIFEAKGLEWPFVVIWAVYEGVWASLPDEAQSAYARHAALRQLFVGITRAREGLVVVNTGDRLARWMRDMLNLQPTELVQWSQDISLADWKEQGLRFLEQGELDKAVAYLREARETDTVKALELLMAVQQADPVDVWPEISWERVPHLACEVAYVQLASHFTAHPADAMQVAQRLGKHDECALWQARCDMAEGRYEQAAAYFEAHQAFGEAGHASEKAGNVERAVANFMKAELDKEVVRLLEPTGELGDLLVYLHGRKQYELASDVLDRNGRSEEALAGYIQSKSWYKAGVLAQRLGAFEAAADYFQKANRMVLSADAWILAGQRLRALEAVKKHPRPEARLQWFKKHQCWEEVAYGYEEQNDLVEANIYFKRAAEQAIAEKDYLQAVRIFERLDKLDEVARCLILAESYEEAGQVLSLRPRQAQQAILNAVSEAQQRATLRYYPDSRAAARLAEYLKLWEEAASFWALLEEGEAEGRALEQAGNIDAALNAYRKASAFRAVATLLERVGRLEEALDALALLEDYAGQGRVLMALGRDREALRLFQAQSMPREAIRLAVRLGALPELYAWLEEFNPREAAHWLRDEGCFAEAGVYYGRAELSARIPEMWRKAERDQLPQAVQRAFMDLSQQDETQARITMAQLLEKVQELRNEALPELFTQLDMEPVPFTPKFQK